MPPQYFIPFDCLIIFHCLDRPCIYLISPLINIGIVSTLIGYYEKCCYSCTIFVWMYIFWSILRSEIAGLYGNSKLNLFKNYYTCFQNALHHLHSYQQCMRFPLPTTLVIYPSATFWFPLSWWVWNLMSLCSWFPFPPISNDVEASFHVFYDTSVYLVCRNVFRYFAFVF